MAEQMKFIELLNKLDNCILCNAYIIVGLLSFFSNSLEAVRIKQTPKRDNWAIESYKARKPLAFAAATLVNFKKETEKDAALKHIIAKQDACDAMVMLTNTSPRLKPYIKDNLFASNFFDSKADQLEEHVDYIPRKKRQRPLPHPCVFDGCIQCFKDFEQLQYHIECFHPEE